MSFCVFGTHPQTSLNHQRERKLGFQGENEIWKKKRKVLVKSPTYLFFCSQCFLCVLWTIIHFYQDWRKNLKKSRQSGTPCIRLKSMTLSTIQCNMYRKVASSRPVYYSIFYLFWGATNQDVLLTETCYYCYIQKSIKWWVHKGPCVFSSIFVNSQWLALFLQTPFKNVLKTLDGAFLLLWKCNFISKNWKNLTRIFEDPTFWIYFSNQNVGSSRILIRFFQFLLG